MLYQKEVYEVAASQTELSKELYPKYILLDEFGKITSTQLLKSKTRAAEDEQAEIQALNDYRKPPIKYRWSQKATAKANSY